MSNMPVRPCNDRQFYDYYNDGGAAMVQYQFALDVNQDDVTFPLFGYIVDDNGVADEAYGKLVVPVGAVFQIDQIDATVDDLARNDALYMSPGQGNLHAVALEGDYCVAKLVEAQGDNDWVLAQLIPPFPVEEAT